MSLFERGKMKNKSSLVMLGLCLFLIACGEKTQDINL